MILTDMLYKPALEYIKLEPFTGSYEGFRYRLWSKVEKYEDNGKEKKKIVGLLAAGYPEPFCYEKTEPEKITEKEFEFSQEGLDEAIAWLGEIQENY